MTTAALVAPQADRRNFIGSSDIAAILGVSRFTTAYECWQKKTAEVADESESNSVQRRGHRVEPLIVRTLEEEYGFRIVSRNTYDVHPVYSFMRAESDFVYASNVGAGMLGHGEAKSVGFGRDGWGEVGTQEVPPDYLAQVLFALDCKPHLSEATIAAGFGFDDVRPYTIEPNPELQDAIIKMAADFWHDFVLPRIPPPSQTTNDCVAKIERLSRGFRWTVNEQAAEALRVMRELKRERKQLDRLIEAAEFSLFEQVQMACEVNSIALNEDIDGADVRNIALLDANGTKLASWNLQKRAAYMCKASQFRVLRIKSEKGGE